jgi:hypothetical protein
MLIMRPSGGERAWFLAEESEPRNKEIFLAGENCRAEVSANLTISLPQGLEMLLFHSGGLTILSAFIYHGSSAPFPNKEQIPCKKPHRQ